MTNGGDFLPPEWEDEERMGVLFLPLPPSGPARGAKIAFWGGALGAWLRAAGRVTFTQQVSSEYLFADKYNMFRILVMSLFVTGLFAHGLFAQNGPPKVRLG